jgi:tRNA/rRNA methyltransferase
MPGAGTDKTKAWTALPGPVVVLVEPQLGENIGAAARAMANFGLSRLRLVKPRQAWPNPQARMLAAGADRVLEGAELFDSLEAAIADCTLVLAATARAHDQAKPVIDAAEAARQMAPPVGAGETVAVMFGRERYGLEGHEVGLADRIITFPVNPAFASLNLGQAVLIVAYEWFKLTGTGLPFETPNRSPLAGKEQLLAFFNTLEGELEKIEFFRPPDKRATMQINLRNIFQRMELTQQDIQTLHGVVNAIASGRKGPARGGILDGEQAGVLRNLLAGEGQGRSPGGLTPSRGLARLLRRNPTEPERKFWDALTRDRRFAGYGFKRQVPIGPHIPDVVSFPLRMVIEIVPTQESAEASTAREARRAWLESRDYRVIDIRAQAVEREISTVLSDLAKLVIPAPPEG